MFARLGFVACLTLSIAEPHLVHAEGTTQPTPTPNTTPVVKEMGLHTADVMALQAQMKTKGTMPPAYWRDVAQCETSQNWQDKGKWGGGLGIATTTWRGFGGYEFAKHPSQATPEEQMIIANRIAVFGYQTKREYLTLDDKLNNKPFFRPKAGFFGWGCIANNRYLHPKNWRDNNRKLWRQSKRDVLFPHG